MGENIGLVLTFISAVIVLAGLYLIASALNFNISGFFGGLS